MFIPGLLLLCLNPDDQSGGQASGHHDHGCFYLELIGPRVLIDSG